MAIIGKAYNPFGMPSNGSGLASGFKYAQGLKDRETFARGFSNYVNATNDAQKASALQEMASVDGQSAMNLYNSAQEMAAKNQITPYQRESLDLQRNQLDWQRENAENARKMNEYQTWQKDEALRKEQESKEKEKLLGDALYRYQTAPDDETKKAALAEVYRVSPEFAKDILKKQKEAEKKGYGNSELGLMIDVQMNPENYSPEVVQYVKDYGRVKIKDPYLRGVNEYEGTVGKQYAEAGLPYSNYGQAEQIPVQKPMPSTFGGYMDTQTQQTQAIPMQAQPVQQIPTAAQLAADKKRAEKEAEQTVKQKENVRLAKQSSDYLDDTIKMVEETPDDVFSPFANFYQKAGVITNGMIGFDRTEQAARGEIGRRIGIVQNDILAEARAKGQTGINTMAEIRQATKGIDENSGKPALLAALRLLKNIKERLAQMPDEEGYTQPEEEIIYYEDL